MPSLCENDTPMFVFFVDEMVNSRIAGAVTRAVRALDPGAAICCNSATQRLDIEPSSADAQDIVDILSVAGFTATLAGCTSESAFAWVDSRHATRTEVPVSEGVASYSATSGISLLDFGGPLMGTRDSSAQGITVRDPFSER